MPEWVLVLILLQNYPANISTVYKAPYATVEDCLEEREVLVDLLKLTDPQAVCIEVLKREAEDG